MDEKSILSAKASIYAVAISPCTGTGLMRRRRRQKGANSDQKRPRGLIRAALPLRARR